MLDRALFCTFWVFGQTVSLVLEEFDFAEDLRAEFNEMVASTHVFRQLSEDDLRGVGRNDLCPCDSGSKYKHCHGK